MKFPHLFEFMDLDWLPKSLRNTLRDILECGNAKPFRPYYAWAAETIINVANRVGAKNIVELGAGTAPLTRHLAQNTKCNAKLIPCDRNPDTAVYEDLKKSFPGVVEPHTEPIDFSITRAWPESTLLVLSATLHHLPREARRQAIIAMSKSADAVLILEPLRRTIASGLFVIGSAVPAVLLPLLFIARPGGSRRFIWCWLIPVAPIAFLWDGWISCIREWHSKEYEDAVKDEPVTCEVKNHGLFSQSVLIRRLGER